MAEVADPRRLVAERLPDARYVVVAGARHDLLMETDDRRAVVWAAFYALADEAALRWGRRGPSPAAGTCSVSLGPEKGQLTQAVRSRQGPVFGDRLGAVRYHRGLWECPLRGLCRS